MKYQRLVHHVNDCIDYYLVDSNFNPTIVQGLRHALNGGKRLRPAITLAIMQKLDPTGWQRRSEVCLIPEFLHTASLIIDDLPAFDNATERRGQQCLHLAESEGVVYLTALTLVTEAMAFCHDQLDFLKQNSNGDHETAFKRYESHIQNVLSNLSAEKAVEGQLLSTDALAGDHPVTIDQIVGIIDKKTSSFFEIALVTGWMMGMGDSSKLDKIKDLAFNLGLCYQIYDDFLDYHEDQGCSRNYVVCAGIEQGYKDFIGYQTNVDTLLDDLDLDCELFEYMRKFLFDTVYEKYTMLK